MKVELHLHTNRYSLCAVNTPQQMMGGLIEAGYGAVYITEHDAVWPNEQLDELREQFPEIRIFLGLEKMMGSHHLLILGTNDPAYLEMGDAATVLDKARAEGHLTILAHPYRWEGAADMLAQGLLPDAIEYRTCNQDGLCADLAMDAAEKYHLPAVNAGDAHALHFIDRFWIEAHRPVQQAGDIRGIVLDGAYSLEMRE